MDTNSGWPSTNKGLVQQAIGGSGQVEPGSPCVSLYNELRVLSEATGSSSVHDTCITECPKIYRNSLLHLLKYRFAVNFGTLRRQYGAPIVCCEMGDLICVRHLFNQTAVANMKFILREKRSDIHHSCATYAEVPSNTIAMVGSERSYIFICTGHRNRYKKK